MTWYRHYKGGVYQVLMEGTHTETGEQMVVYQGDNGRIWIRPAGMFHENLPDGTPRFRPIRDPSQPRWRSIPGWCDPEGRGWQISDCGQIRDTGDPQYVYNDHGEIAGVSYESIDFSPTCIHLYDGEREAFFEFSELKKAARKDRLPVPIRIVEVPETD